MSADLKALQESQKSKDQVFGAKPLFENGSSLTSMTTVDTERKYYVFKLVKKKRGRTRIDRMCDGVVNPKTGKRERIWLLNSAHSIWQSEIMDLLKDKDFVSRNSRGLVFEDGICRVKAEDELALEFARANTKNVGKRRNGSGKFDYYEYDPQEEQKDRLERETLKVTLVAEIAQMKEEKIKKLASFFGINFMDEIGFPKTPEGIKTELMLKAQSHPTEVKKYIGSEEVEVSFMVKKAILDSKIDLGTQGGNAIWSGGGGFICKIPADRKHYEYLTELAMTNSKEGKEFKEQLQKIVV